MVLFPGDECLALLLLLLFPPSCQKSGSLVLILCPEVYCSELIK